MSLCVKIEVLPPAAAPDFMIEQNGMVVLDINDDTTIALSKQLEALTDISKIKTDSVLGFSIPATPKNDLVLKDVVRPNKLNNNYSPIRALLVTGSTVVRQKDLFVISYNKNAGYECELRNGEANWAVALNNLKLKDVVLLDQDFVFSMANINAQNALGEYTDNTNGVRFPLVWYGQWIDSKLDPPLTKINKIGVPDLRPHYSVLWILQKAFCQIGYKFRSPILETDYGRRLIAYILDKDYGSDPTIKENRKFDSKLIGNRQFTEDQRWSSINFDEVYDPGGLYDPAFGYYSGAGVHDINVDMTFDWLNDQDVTGTIDCHVRLCMTFETDSGLMNVVIREEIGTMPAVPLAQGGYSVWNCKFTQENLSIPIAAFIYVTVHFIWHGLYGRPLYLTIHNNSRFWGEPKKVFITEGDSFAVEKLIDPDYTVLDFLKGITHLFAGKFKTDFNLNEVWLYQTYRGDVPGTNDVEGFFIDDESDDLDEYIVPESTIIKTPTRELKRYELIKFKGDGDKAIEKLQLDSDKPYLSYKIDYGAQFDDETVTNENIFFEATHNGYYADQETFDLNIPFMLDNTDGELSFDIKPRVLYWHGLTQQFYSAGFLAVVTIRMFGQDTSNIPFAYQFTDARVGDIVNNVQPSNNIAYGEMATIRRPNILNKDLFHYFWQKWVAEYNFSMTIEVLAHLDRRHFQMFDFRKVAKFTALGKTTYARMLEINNFQVCASTSTPVLLMPNIQVLNECVDLPGDNDPNNPDDPNSSCIGNSPELIIDHIGDCYYFSLGGSANSPISGVTFEYKYDSGATWVAATSLCNPTDGFEVRMIVAFTDECPELTRKRHVDACGNDPILTGSYNYSEECFTALVSGLITSEIDNIIIEYSIDDGVTWLPYTIGTCEPVSAGTILIRAIIEYIDGCPNSEIETEIIIPPDPPECEGTTADVECTNNGMLIRTGVVAGEIALDIIEYRYPPDTTWRIWDEVTPVQPCPFEYRRVIFFCNNECPTYCGPVHECNCANCEAAVSLSHEFNVGVTELTVTANVTGCIESPVFTWSIKDVGDGQTAFTLLPDVTNPLVLNWPGGTSGKVVIKVNVVCGDCLAEDEIPVTEICDDPEGSPQNMAICNDL